MARMIFCKCSITCFVAYLQKDCSNLRCIVFCKCSMHLFSNLQCRFFKLQCIIFVAQYLADSLHSWTKELSVVRASLLENTIKEAQQGMWKMAFSQIREQIASVRQEESSVTFYFTVAADHFLVLGGWGRDGPKILTLDHLHSFLSHRLWVKRRLAGESVGYI